MYGMHVMEVILVKSLMLEWALRPPFTLDWILNLHYLYFFQRLRF